MQKYIKEIELAELYAQRELWVDINQCMDPDKSHELDKAKWLTNEEHLLIAERKKRIKLMKKQRWNIQETLRIREEEYLEQGLYVAARPPNWQRFV